jgi:hypothetical protein
MSDLATSLSAARNSARNNPFLLMLNPEIVLAAIEQSENLAQLNRHTCRPLDKVQPVPGSEAAAANDPVLDVDADATCEAALVEVGETAA